MAQCDLVLLCLDGRFVVDFDGSGVIFIRAVLQNG